jgi:oligopeptide transport system substrate-binding protein
VEFRREKETIPTFNKFLQGYYDTSGVSNESFEKVVRDKELSPEMRAMGVRLNKSVFAGVYYLGFNMDDPVVGKAGGERAKKLRQAMSLAVDFKEFARIFTNDRGVPAQTPIPPGLFGYDPDYKNPYRQVDLGRAKKLLAEAGYENGIDPKTKAPLHLTFDVGSTDSDRQLQFKFYTNEWRKIGLNVTVEATSYNKFQQKVRDGAYQIFIWGWMADYPDPENFLFLLWSQMARSKNNGPNTANFSDPEYDRLFSKMSTMENGPERLAIIRQMRDILEDQRPWIELYHPENYALYHEWLSNVKTPGLSLITTKYRDIDPELRAERRKEWNEPRMWPAYLLLALIAAVVIPGVRTFLRERQ